MNKGSVLKKKKSTPWFQIILKSSSNQNSMVLAEKQIYRPMGQGWEPRNKNTFISAINFKLRSQKYTTKKEKLL